jgi:hypothetical protein
MAQVLRDYENAVSRCAKKPLNKTTFIWRDSPIRRRVGLALAPTQVGHAHCRRPIRVVTAGLQLFNFQWLARTFEPSILLVFSQVWHRRLFVNHLFFNQSALALAPQTDGFCWRRGGHLEQEAPPSSPLIADAIEGIAAGLISTAFFARVSGDHQCLPGNILSCRTLALYRTKGDAMNVEPKKQEPDIPPPVPEVEPERNVPEIPPDKDVPEKKGPIQALE